MVSPEEFKREGELDFRLTKKTYVLKVQPDHIRITNKGLEAEYEKQQQ